LHVADRWSDRAPHRDLENGPEAERYDLADLLRDEDAE